MSLPGKAPNAFRPSQTFIRAFTSRTTITSPIILLAVISLCTIFISARFEKFYSRKTLEIYDIAKVFGIAAFNGTDFDKETDTRYLEDVLQTYPDSIGAHYLRLKQKICSRQRVSTEIRSLKESFSRHKRSNKLARTYSLSQKSTTITVHIGEVPMTREIMIELLSHVDKFGFSSILLVSFSRIHVLKSTISNVLELAQGRKLNLAAKILDEFGVDAKAHVCSEASNLFAHSDELGALLALSNSKGRVILSKSLRSFIANDEYKWKLKDGVLVNNLKDLSEPERRFRAMGPIIPSCCLFKGYGTGDQQKMVCEHDGDFLDGECWVLSLGSNNKWLFEEDVVRRTNCTVEVFDCTGNFTVPASMEGRVHFHQICAGKKTDVTRKTFTLLDIMSLGSRKSGFEETVAPAIAKLDIEGWEYTTLRHFFQSPQSEAYYPKQILAEIHTSSGKMYDGISHPLGRERKSPSDIIANFFRNLSSVGYEFVYRADNPFCPDCSEVTLLLSRR